MGEIEIIKTNNNYKKHKVVLSMLPFWTPLIPPQAPAQLKGFVEKHSKHIVRAVDFNVMNEFRELYNRYFSTLRSYVPLDHQGNFLNVGHDVLQNHMMAHFNHEGRDEEYIELVKLVIYENYFADITDEQVKNLNKILDEVFFRIDENLVKIVEREQPDIMGFTAYLHTLPAVVYTCKFIKERYPNITTLIGGGTFIWQLTEGNPDYDYFLEKTKDYIDKIFIGTGQFLLLKYLNGELDDSKRIYTTEDITEVLNYSNFVLPDLSEYDLDYYPYIAISGSTSCPYKCSFCSINKYYGEYTKKTPKKSIEEINELKTKYNRNLFFMIDSLINPIINGLSKEIIKEKVGLYFDGYFRVDKPSANIENTLLWRRAGFYRARIGVESGSQRVLNLMGKKITIDETRASLKALAQAGIKTTTFWVIGHPGETEEDFEETLEFLEEMKDYIYEAEYNPFYYYYTNQSNTDEWSGNAELLYPEKYRDMIVTQTWILNSNPTRKEMFDRVNRFEKKRKELGIPNPYTMEQINAADERWRRLHKNAVPPLVEIQTNVNHSEKENVQQLHVAKEAELDNEIFEFNF